MPRSSASRPIPSARRHDQDRPPRLAVRHDHRPRPAGPCRLSASGRQSGAWADDSWSTRCSFPSSTRAPRISSRPTSRSLPSTSATRPPTSSRRRRQRRSTSASTTAGPMRRCRPKSTTARPGEPDARNTGRARRPLSSYELVWRDRPSHVFLTRDDQADRNAEPVRSRRWSASQPTLSTSGGTSDARFIKDYCPVVEFGLVGKTMHMVDERVAARRTRNADTDLPALHRRLVRQG
jgi:hypothetical protein